MNLRRAVLTDTAALASLEQTQKRAAGWGKGGFETELAQPCALIWCAEKEEKLVGFIAARFAVDTAEILNVAVHPAYVRQGVARALLGQTLADLKQCGIGQVSLEVAQDNCAACALYKQAGFERLNVRKNFYGQGQNAWIMGKKL